MDKKILVFLKKLQDNNRKGWIDENRVEYDEARKSFELQVQKLINEIGKFDASIKGVEAKACIFRINRDVRFSKNKAPYKNNFAAYFHQDGKKGEGAGYYLHIEPGASFLAAGFWMPPADALAKIRQEIDYQYTDWNKILKNTSFKKHFTEGLDQSAKLSRPPKGYDEENAAIDFLKLKTFILRKQITEAEIVHKQFVNHAAAAFEAAKPMVDFINQAQH